MLREQIVDKLLDWNYKIQVWDSSGERLDYSTNREDILSELRTGREGSESCTMIRFIQVHLDPELDMPASIEFTGETPTTPQEEWLEFVS